MCVPDACKNTGEAVKENRRKYQGREDNEKQAIACFDRAAEDFVCNAVMYQNISDEEGQWSQHTATIRSSKKNAGNLLMKASIQDNIHILL